MSEIRSHSRKRLAKDTRDSDGDAGVVQKLKQDLKHSGLSRDASEFAGRLLHNYQSDGETQVGGDGEKFLSAFRKTVKEMPTGRQPQIGGMREPLEDSRQNTDDEEGDDQGSEAEHAGGSYCSDSDDQFVQHTTVQEGKQAQSKKKKKRRRARCSFFSWRLVISCGVVVVLSICALNFTVLDNKLAEIIMNNPFLSSKWDELGGKSIRILITGKTGTGKSALINGLVGQKVAVEGDTLDPQTSEVQQIKRMVQGVSMSIFDSPGLQDGTKREYEYMQDMQRKCRSVDLVLYAIRMTDQRVQAEDTTAMRKLTKVFGVEFWNRVIFVLTFANEVQDPVDPEDEIKTEAHFKKRLEVWKEFLPEIVEERTKIPAEIVRRIPIIPVGYYNIRDLPGQKLWFTKFWLAALNRMKEAGANGAGYMLEFSKDRIKTSDQTTDQDFEKPIYEQPIVYEE